MKAFLLDIFSLFILNYVGIIISSFILVFVLIIDIIFLIVHDVVAPKVVLTIVGVVNCVGNIVVDVNVMIYYMLQVLHW